MVLPHEHLGIFLVLRVLFSPCALGHFHTDLRARMILTRSPEYSKPTVLPAHRLATGSRDPAWFRLLV